MKKSKVLLPVLGLSILSVAASVTGTVAWFTASRTVSFEVTDVTITNPEGAMTASFSAGTATVVSEDGSGISFKEKAKLRDASINFGTNNALEVYRSHLDGTGTDIDGYSKLSDTSATYMENVYYVATWSAAFTINGDSSLSYAVYFNPADSVFTEIDTPNSIHNAIRVAMYTNEEYAVWAPARASATVDHVKAASAPVSGEDASAKATRLAAARDSFVNTNVSSTTTNNQYLTVNDTTYTSLATAKTDAKYLGLANGGVAITVNFVLWFEGCDPDCLSSVLGTGAACKSQFNLAFNCIDTSSWSA